MVTKPVIYALLLLTIISCASEKDDPIIATVYDAHLYHSDLKEIVGEKQLTIEDSSKLVEDFISRWTQEQVLVHHALLNEKIDKKNIDFKTQQYKQTLLVHQLQNLKIKQKLDTIISDEAIQTYYNSHKADFLLKDYLVKVIYIKVAEDAPELDQLSVWYKLNKPTDLEAIKKYVSLYATNFYYDNENWVYFDEITKEIPLHDINKDRFITRKSEIKFSEDGYFYFLNIIDYKLKDAASPIEFEVDNIKQRIMNTRIFDLREQINHELIQSAHAQNEIKIH